MAAREYPYGKSILLNAVYDMLDRLGIPIAFADSQAGILRFAHGTGAGEMELTAILRNGEEVTRVEIADTDGELPDVLLDEISSTLRQSCESVTRRTTAGKKE